MVLNARFWPKVLIGRCGEKQPHDSEFSAECAAIAGQLDFGLCRNLKRVINFNSKVSIGTFQLAVSQQELNSAQFLRSNVASVLRMVWVPKIVESSPMAATH